jgi:hypothetical protein
MSVPLELLARSEELIWVEGHREGQRDFVHARTQVTPTGDSTVDYSPAHVQEDVLARLAGGHVVGKKRLRQLEPVTSVGQFHRAGLAAPSVRANGSTPGEHPDQRRSSIAAPASAAGSGCYPALLTPITR